MICFYFCVVVFAPTIKKYCKYLYIDSDEGNMQRQKRLNYRQLNICYFYVQMCIANSNNNKLDSKSHLCAEIVF